MKILIVNTYDMKGGAARAAYRLHKALLAEAIDSQMLVQTKNSDSSTVSSLNENKFQKGFTLLRPAIDQLPLKCYKNKTKISFSPSWFGCSGMVDKINEINPDIVHLHWINEGFLRVEDIAKIKAPIVWSLHDMWAFTGGCHYSENCLAYEEECGKCHVLGSAKENDLSRKVFRRKQQTFSKIKNITIVGLSKWLHTCSKQSTLLQEKNNINLPNPIQTDTFKPINKDSSRELWSLPKDKRLILFSAMDATSDPRKGFIELMRALHTLENKDIEFVVCGSSEPRDTQDFGFKTHYLGQLNDDMSLVTLYSAVDVMVVPSLQENLSNSIMESLACATPVVGFDIGGNSDMIEHKHNGYLAKPFDEKDLAEGIQWIINNENYETLCQKAREKVLKEFDSKAVAQKYIALYHEVLYV